MTGQHILKKHLSQNLRSHFVGLALTMLLPEQTLAQGTAVAQSGAGTTGPSQGAFQNSRERSLAVAAEQAYAELDYAQALKLGSQVLAENPRNITMRRLAASSALQLKRYNDCLRILSVLSIREASADDAHTLGECSAGAGGFSPSILKFFELSRNTSDKADAAAYWLGVYHYREGNYTLAKKHLENVVILPSRFEEQKKFMLERLADILQGPHAAPQSQQTTGTGTGTPPPGQSGTGKRAERKPAEKKAFEALPRKKPENGYFTNFTGTFRGGAAAGLADSVGVLPGDQKKYDTEVAEAVVKKRDPDAALISKRNGSMFSPLAMSSAELQTGYRTDDFVNDKGTEYAFDLMLSGGYSSMQTPLYAVVGTKVHPSNSIVFHQAGAGVRAGTHAMFRPFPAVGLRITTYVDRLMSEFERQLGLYGAEAEFSLHGRNFFVGFGAYWALMHGEDFEIGGHWNGLAINAGLNGLGIFSIKAPRGFTLFSYQVSAPIPGSRTRGVFQIVSTEGQFIEVNLAPSVTLFEVFRAMLWYRYVSGSKRSYLSTESQKLQQNQGDFGVKFPDSQYDSTLSDVYAAIEYSPWSWGGFTGGVSVSFFSTRYNLYDVPTNPNTGASPILFAPLLDQGKQNVTAAFIEFFSKF